MCLAAGHPVQKLRRVSYAGVGLGGLAPGAMRHLTAAELAQLRRAVREGAGGSPRGDPAARSCRCSRRRSSSRASPPSTSACSAWSRSRRCCSRCEGARRPFLAGFGRRLGGVHGGRLVGLLRHGALRRHPPVRRRAADAADDRDHGGFWGLFAWAHARLRRARPAACPTSSSSRCSGRRPSTCAASLPDLEFPWALLGQSLYRQLPLIQIADLGGRLGGVVPRGAHRRRRRGVRARPARPRLGRRLEAARRRAGRAGALRRVRAVPARPAARGAEPARRGRAGERAAGREVGPALPRGDVPHPRGADAGGGGRRRGPGRLVRVRDGLRVPAGAGVPAAAGGARRARAARRCSSARRRSRRAPGSGPCATAPTCSGRTGRSPAGRTSSNSCRSASSCRSSGCSSSPGRSCRRSGTSSRGSGRRCWRSRAAASARWSATR